MVTRSAPGEGGLTPKQARFVSEYLKDLNATHAAVRCGYRAKSARVQGARLLTNAAVGKSVAKAEALQLEANQVSARRTIEEARRISYGNLLPFFDVHGNLKHVSEWTPDIGAMVSKIEVVTKNVVPGNQHTDRVVRLPFWNKMQALELLLITSA